MSAWWWFALGTLTSSPPQVVIESPASGWSTERVVSVSAKASGKVKSAEVAINGVSFRTRLNDGMISQNLVLSRGPNAIEVLVRDEAGATARDRVHLVSEVPNIDMQVFLIFDPQPFYVDLWVTDPSGERCFWAHRNTAAGGTLHDLYNNAEGGGVGLGPQTFSLTNATAGEYLIQVNYWAGGSYGDAVDPATGSVYGDRRQPVVPIRVEVVQYEGTAHERRQTLTGLLAKPSDTYTVGRVAVHPPAERGEIPFDPDQALQRGVKPQLEPQSQAGSSP